MIVSKSLYSCCFIKHKSNTFTRIKSEKPIKGSFNKGDFVYIHVTAMIKGNKKIGNNVKISKSHKKIQKKKSINKSNTEKPTKNTKTVIIRKKS
ncbi:MAG: hypothetical protein DRQ78_05900 [Epsilonproteobacteria bacterium]|nr:MAG: hypothetical protein DRQ78_05900 [Campylobacterota bacterium]